LLLLWVMLQQQLLLLLLWVLLLLVRERRRRGRLSETIHDANRTLPLLLLLCSICRVACRRFWAAVSFKHHLSI
jgi:hypothetical protein